ncbi:MAG: tylosin resistance protein [Chlamydiales bacterium]|jgi:ATP-binding cassette subfamily F protein uup|nr:tylosin resistance protein [Chlamydiales bacterium]
MTPLLNGQALSKTYGAEPLFKHVSFSIFKGERVGLIGPNGSGKSTFLKLLSGIDSPDEGAVSYQSGIQVEYIPQESLFDPNLTIKQIFDKELANFIDDEFVRDAAIQTSAGKCGIYDLDRTVQKLSGGWKKRLAIAIALSKEPDLILMDEPTNHLDVEGIIWLEKLVKKGSWTCLIITHDRYFLENVTTRVVEINRIFPEGTFSTSGNYSTFLERRETFLEGQQQYERSLANRMRREVEWLRRGPKARTTKAESRIKEAHRVIQEHANVKSRNTQQTAQIDFNASGRKTKKLFVGEGLDLKIGDKKIFTELNLELAPGTCLGVLGLNGSGKSSLLKVIAGELKPTAGSIEKADALKIVYFDQHRAKLDLKSTIRETLATNGETVFYQGQSIHVASWAKRFLFGADKINMPLYNLSGGERARLVIAKLMLEPADLLLLDEPTNDLDIATLEILEESLENFQGAVVLVTHDRYLLDRLSTEILALDNQGEHNLYADYLQWEQFQKEQEKSTVQIEAAKKKGSEKLSTPDNPPKSKKLSYKEKLEWDQMEGKIMQAEEQLDSLKIKSQDPAIVNQIATLSTLCEQMQQVQEEIDRLYARWSELEAKQK